MEEYKKLLNGLDLKSLKGFIKKYMKHVKILVSKKKKEELIEHIMEHTELRDGKVFLKITDFDLPEKIKQEPKEPKEKKEKKEPKKEELLDKILKSEKQKEKDKDKITEKVVDKQINELEKIVDDNKNKLDKKKYKLYKNTLKELKEEVVKLNIDRAFDNLKILQNTINEELKQEPKEEPIKEKKERRQLKEENLKIIKKIINDKPKESIGDYYIGDLRVDLYEMENDSHFSEISFILKEEGRNDLDITDGNIKYNINKMFDYNDTTKFNERGKHIYNQIIYIDTKNSKNNFILNIYQSVDEKDEKSKPKKEVKTEVKTYRSLGDKIKDKEIELLNVMDFDNYDTNLVKKVASELLELKRQKEILNKEVEEMEKKRNKRK